MKEGRAFIRSYQGKRNNRKMKWRMNFAWCFVKSGINLVTRPCQRKDVSRVSSHMLWYPSVFTKVSGSIYVACQEWGLRGSCTFFHLIENQKHCVANSSAVHYAGCNLRSIESWVSRNKIYKEIYSSLLEILMKDSWVLENWSVFTI